ncbi:short-chain fatty acid transporter [Halanaeroarchaeum sulfurireducens]|uniref:Short chain fatty acids transporter n=1 Tax=Halanaeroarchaeum sulfurireducens TaxID=1604004 RepID=A0A0F7PBD4_9EURY|nr:TIGR00366 family protein [Halanaeroarchaeum sulfurireducens]AKH97480.1 short chain fatty acids transporter [Halanaeroarchaeum sulfurireducens]ALG81876.1 short chain fatty acids transporter [Halanaeroarchaeum sulfurireducens]
MAPAENETAVQRTGRHISRVIERWMPSPFLFAIILTLVVYVGGIGIENQGPVRMLEYWNGGFWNLLTFAMQMVLILATGYVLAYHPRIQSGIRWLARLPSNGAQAVVVVGVSAMVLAWIQWGLGLIIGAILAREVGRQAHERGMAVHYPLLGVAGYMGLGLTWHWGLSGSAPLLMNTPENVFISEGIVDQLIPTTATIFHPYTLVLLVGAIVYTAVLLYLLSPPASESEGITEFVPEEELTSNADVVKDGDGEGNAQATATPADRLNNSRVLGVILGLFGIIMTVDSLLSQGLGALNLNVVNFAFLFIGLALFTRPNVYQERFTEAVTSTSGVILQFPFYAGIMGMMNQSGLSETLAETLISLSGPTTFPAVAWITAGIANIFVPSGGGEWTVTGPAILEAAQEMGVPYGQAVIAYSVGDAHTNLFQPFWALPLLGITGLRARDMFGYAVTVMLFLTPFLAIALIMVPY